MHLQFKILEGPRKTNKQTKLESHCHSSSFIQQKQTLEFLQWLWPLSCCRWKIFPAKPKVWIVQVNVISDGTFTFVGAVWQTSLSLLSLTVLAVFVAVNRSLQNTSTQQNRFHLRKHVIWQHKLHNTFFCLPTHYLLWALDFQIFLVKIQILHEDYYPLSPKYDFETLRNTSFFGGALCYHTGTQHNLTIPSHFMQCQIIILDIDKQICIFM